MSKSFKKYPGGKTKDRGYQKIASRYIRRNKILLIDGMYYKKTYERYNIVDYTWYVPFKYFMNILGKKEFTKKYSHRYCHNTTTYKTSCENIKKLNYLYWKKQYYYK